MSISTRIKKKAFLDTLRRGGSVTAAARAAGVNRRTSYRWREKDAAFATACDEAMQEGTDALEDVLRDHAMDGTDKPITHMGVITGTYKVFDHQLALRILEARRPDVWVRKSKTELTGANGGPVAVSQISRTVVDPDER